MTKKDQELPFAGHVIRTLEYFHIIQDFVSGMFMWTQEVVVGNPESQVIVGTVDVIKSIRVAVRSLIRAVQPFDHLFEWTVFFRDSIVVGKSNDLSDLKGKDITEFFSELHCSKRIGAVAIRNEFKIFRKFCKLLESHAHSEDTGNRGRL